MPLISMKSGKLSKEVKKNLIKKLTSAASEAMSMPESHYTVFIEEHDFDAIGVGGEQFSERMKN